MSLLTALVALVLFSSAARGDDQFRTDSSNAQHPWYQLKAGEFPPAGSEHRVRGEIVEADYVHRTGQYRVEGTGELVNFSLLPYACVYHLNTEADLRDIPLGTRLLFYLYQDEKGQFSRAAVVQDDFTQLAASGMVYRVGEVKAAENKLTAARQKPGESVADRAKEELAVADQTQIWKGDQRIKFTDLAPGDELLADFTGNRCSEIWVGAETQKRATDQQRKKHVAFLKQRGLAARIDGVEKKKLTVTFYGDPASLAALFKDEGIIPEQWAKEHRRVHAVCANEELRTYNPPVDGQGSSVMEFKPLPTDRYGCGGGQWTIETSLLIEGFRKGRTIRIFFGWPVDDMPMGEGLYTERHDTKPEEESVNQYSYRTDFGNENLSWYQLKPGQFPPYMSQHEVKGELVKIDPVHRAGQFRTDRTGELVDFTMPPFGYVQYLNADAELSDLPLGTRYTFWLYRDDKGAFTRAAVITDEFTRMYGETLTWRVQSPLKIGEGKIFAANQLAEYKDDKEHMVRPPDLGQAEFRVGDATRVWKNDQQVKLSDIAVGDELLINPTASTPTARTGCADIWIGADTHKKAMEKQRVKHIEFMKHNGLPAWIEKVDGKRLTVNFFAGSKRSFQDTMNGEPQMLVARLADDDLHPTADAALPLRFKDHLSALDTAGTYGSANVRWVVEAESIPDTYRPGRVIRVSRTEWVAKAN